MIISVDHGNKSIKTPNALFTSGLIVSEGLQGFKTDYICWNKKYYTLTEQRIAYLRDKTEDERFYVLTLFAIAKELERRKVPETLDPIDITLLVGLPPAHYEQLHSRFEQYFLRRREIVDFEYNGKYYSIRVSKVLSYPQAFAAAVSLNSTAYLAEVLRGGILAVDAGQMEAARSLGMTHWQAMRKVVFPQAIKNSLPAIGNEFIINIKDSSVLCVVGVSDLMFMTRSVAGIYYKGTECYLIAAIVYLFLTYLSSLLLKAITGKMTAPDNTKRHQGNQTVDLGLPSSN